MVTSHTLLVGVCITTLENNFSISSKGEDALSKMMVKGNKIKKIAQKDQDTISPDWSNKWRVPGGMMARKKKKIEIQIDLFDQIFKF